jgi:signal transduction histidine kinase
MRDFEARLVVCGDDEVLAIVRDITERKNIERLKSEFVSTVSHELRTPLTSILGSLGLLTGGATGELPEKVRAMIEIAHKNSERLVRLINDILDIDKIESGKMDFNLKPVELAPLVAHAIESNHAYGRQFGVTFELNNQAADARVLVDADRLIQALTNLLSNAAKFSPSDDTVEVALRCHGGNVRIGVSDHGLGIPEAFQELLFQKFAQADTSDTRRRGGTGLGLTITKAIIEKLGGQIVYQTQAGRGTTFYLELPVWSESGHSGQPEAQPQAPLVLVGDGTPESAEYKI